MKVLLALLLFLLTACSTAAVDRRECRDRVLEQNINNLENVEELWDNLCG